MRSIALAIVTCALIMGGLYLESRDKDGYLMWIGAGLCTLTLMSD